MKEEDLTVIHIKDEGVYTAWIKALPGLVVQVDKIEDIPKQLAMSVRVVLEYMLENDKYISYEAPIK